MDFTHIHLMFNHVPVIGIPIATVFLGYFIWSRNVAGQRFSLLALLVIAAFAIPVYLTGESAEEKVEHLPGVVESFIENHEDAGKFALVLSIAAGFFAIGSLVLNKNQKIQKRVTVITLLVAVLASIVLARTAFLGGQVRHTEIRSGER